MTDRGGAQPTSPKPRKAKRASPELQLQASVMTDWGALESPISPKPRFYVQAPDGKREWAELDRQAEFFGLMHKLAPRVMVHANSNAGKRNPWKARKEGIMAGVFDVRCEWRFPLTAVIEFKGYNARRPGQLSDAQVDYGNRMVDFGNKAACFFCPVAAVDWLRDMGFPIARARVAA